MSLVDTNVLLRIVQVGHAHHAAAMQAVDLLIQRDQEEFCVAPQSLYEIMSS
jgi:predicted nucleic acid-binding protein